MGFWLSEVSSKLRNLKGGDSILLPLDYLRQGGSPRGTMYQCVGQVLDNSKGSDVHYDGVHGSPWSWAVAKLNKYKWPLRFLFTRERNQVDFILSSTSSSRKKFGTQYTCPGQLLPESVPEDSERPLEVDLSGIQFKFNSHTPLSHLHHHLFHQLL